MKKTIKILATIALFLTLFACSDVAMTGYDESKTTATIDILVTDAGTSDPLDSVVVVYVVNGREKSVKSDTLGRVTIPNLGSGTYRLRLTRAGYADVDVTVPLAPAPDIDMPVVPDADLSLYMYAEGVTLTGDVKIQDAKGVKTLKAGVTVDLTLGGASFVKDVCTTVTDADGKFTFANLPEMASYTVSVRRLVVGEQAFEGTTTWTETGIRTGNVITKPSAFVMTLDAPVLEVNTINTELKSTDELVVSFSQIVDVSKIGLGDIEVTRNGFTEVAVSAVWSDSNKTLTIAPVSGAWGATGAYELALVLKSTAGANFTGTNPIDFGVTAAVVAPAKVTNFHLVSWVDVLGDLQDTTVAVDNSADMLHLAWNDIDGENGYEIWRKRSNEDNFTLLSTNFAGDTTYTADVGGLFTGSNKATFMVVSFTDAGRSDFATAPRLTYP